MKNLFAISFVVISILILSLKDTLNLAHIILHKIPNPFHYHHDFSHHHDEDMYDDSHHHHEDNEHEDHHDELDHSDHDDDHHDDDHDSQDEYHPHTLRDHINLGTDEEEGQQNSNEKTDNSLGIDWDIVPLYALSYQDFFKLVKIKNYFSIDCFNTHAYNPLAPPPEHQ